MPGDGTAVRGTAAGRAGTDTGSGGAHNAAAKRGARQAGHGGTARRGR